MNHSTTTKIIPTTSPLVPTCVGHQCIDNVRTCVVELNHVFQTSHIMAQITYFDPNEQSEHRTKLTEFLKNTSTCSYDVIANDIPVIVYDLTTMSIIAVVVFEAYTNCLYIAYQCVHERYRSQGWGYFLTFAAIHFGKAGAFKRVFSMGVSDQDKNQNYLWQRCAW